MNAISNRALVPILLAMRLAMAGRISSLARPRSAPVGQYPNEAPRSDCGRLGLRERYELPLNHVANPRDYLVNRFGTPAFCWVAGDGNRPTIWNGAPLDPLDPDPLTATGAPGSLPGPWELEDGTRLPLETMDGAVKRETAAPWAIADNEDLVAAVIWQCDATATYALSTRPAGLVGFDMFIGGGGYLYSRFCGGGAAGTAQSAAPIPGVGGKALVVQLMVVDRSDAAAGVKQYINGTLNGQAGCPAGACNPGILALMAQSGGVGAGFRGVLAVALWQGVSVADAWTAARAAELQALATGLEPRGNQAPSKGRPTFGRASAASWQDDDGRWWIASSGMARAGDPKGARFAATRTNRCYNNINPQNATGWATTTGVAPAAVDDSAALATAKAEAWGPNVIEIDNSGGGGDSINWNGAAAGNTNKVSLSCLARIVAGAGARIGLVEPATEVFTDCGAITDGYATRTIVDNITPTATQVWAVKTPAGCKVRLIAYQHESNVFSAACVATTPIPNWATGASAARAAETLTPPVSPRDARGRVSLGVRPLGWSGLAYDAGGACNPVTRSGGLDEVVGGPWSAVAGFRTYDGTTPATATAPLVSGTRKAITVEWAGATQQITADGAAVSSAFDGGRPASGTYKLNSQAGEVAIDSVVFEEAA